MSVQNDNFIPRTVKIPLSDKEEEAFKKMLFDFGQKKGLFLRNAVIEILKKRNYLQANGSD